MDIADQWISSETIHVNIVFLLKFFFYLIKGYLISQIYFNLSHVTRILV